MTELDDALEIIASCAQYRLLKRFEHRTQYAPYPTVAARVTPPVFRGLVADCETTGLSPDDDKIIQLALVPFTFALDGQDAQVLDVGTPYVSYQDPGRPIPSEVVSLTGITDEMVLGKALDFSRVNPMLAETDLAIAHNAGFDRRFLERSFPAAVTKPWACSQKDVPWEKTGSRSTVLEWLLAKHCAEFSEAHSALEDALVVVHVLARATIEGRSALAHLLDAARRPVLRVVALKAPFPKKEQLHARRYRWSDGTKGPKGWYRDVAEADYAQERAWLLSAIYGGKTEERHALTVLRFTAKDRYSVRTEW